MENNDKSTIGLFGKLLGKRNDGEFNAEKAWIESTYGAGTYKDINIRIKEKQTYIKSSIENKFRQVYQNGYHSYSAYHCVIDIEEDLASEVSTIFEPFVKNGFTIINLSEQVSEIDEPHVYLVSWKNAFKTSNKNEHKKQNSDEIEQEISLIEE